MISGCVEFVIGQVDTHQGEYYLQVYCLSGHMHGVLFFLCPGFSHWVLLARF